MALARRNDVLKALAILFIATLLAWLWRNAANGDWHWLD
jgi:hypothetical protein